MYVFFLAPVVFILTILAYKLGRRYERNALEHWEPRRSHELMVAEVDMVLAQLGQLTNQMEQLTQSFQSASDSLNNADYRSFVERKALQNFVAKTFLDTANTIIHKSGYQIRSGPFTEKAAREYLASVLDRVYSRQQTIESATKDILKRVYFEVPHRWPETVHVPVTPEP